jgi:phage-related protein
MSAAMAGGASIVAGLTAGFPALGAAITLITGPIGIAIAAIAGLVAAGVLIYKNWDKIKETLDRVWGAIVDFFTKTIPKAIEKGLKWFSELPGKVAKFMNELPGKIGYALGVALGNIIKFGRDVINWAIAEVPKFIESMMKFIRELPGKIWEQLVAALRRVKEWGNNLISWARSTLPGVISNIVSFFRELPGKLLEIGKDIVRGLWNGISSMAGWIRDKVSDFVGGIVSGVKGVLGIRSPSAVFADIGENLSLGLAKGIKGAKTAVDSALSGLISPQINVGLAGASPAGMGAITNTFVIQNMNVRSDQDIKLIARELHTLQQQAARGRGLA